MSNVVQLRQNDSSLKFNEEQKTVLKDMFFKDCTDAEFNMFIYACQHTALDPFLKQIYPVKRWDKNLNKYVMSIQTGIDGYRLIAERTNKYAPSKEPSYTYDKDGNLISATAYVKKMTVDGTWHEVSATAFYNEYCQRTKEGKPLSMWTNMAHNQLAKCAEALALRKAFPGDFHGTYTKEEMAQAHVEETIEVKPLEEECISEEKAIELCQLLNQCSPKFQNVIEKRLKDLNVSLNLENLPKKLEEPFRKTMEENIAKCKTLLQDKAVGE